MKGKKLPLSVSNGELSPRDQIAQQCIGQHLQELMMEYKQHAVQPPPHTMGWSPARQTLTGVYCHDGERLAFPYTPRHGRILLVPESHSTAQTKDTPHHSRTPQTGSACA